MNDDDDDDGTMIMMNIMDCQTDELSSFYLFGVAHGFKKNALGFISG